MRNASILVIRLQGTATEAIKNMVLAGIGRLTIVDSEDVSEEDLGAGFLFRDEDVGRKVRYFLGPSDLLSASRQRPINGFTSSVLRDSKLRNPE